MSKQKKTTALREKEFKSRLKKNFPIVSIEFIYSPINYNRELSKKLKDEGCFGYHEKESIIINDRPIKIAWLPHVRDMSAAYLELILVRVEKAIQEVIGDCTDDSNVGGDRDSVSSSVG